MCKPRIWMIGLLVSLVVLAGWGCQAKPEGELVGIVFERGHDSAWGNQFSISLGKEEILQTAFFPDGASDQVLLEHLPLPKGEWEEITSALRGLDLKPQKTSLLDKLLKRSKLDGGEWRRLTLTWKTEKGEREVTYPWPADPRATAIEARLEALVAQNDKTDE